MLVDIRWIVLILAFVAALLLARYRSAWNQPILTAVAVATFLLTVLFIVASPMFYRS